MSTTLPTISFILWFPVKVGHSKCTRLGRQKCRHWVPAIFVAQAPSLIYWVTLLVCGSSQFCRSSWSYGITFPCFWSPRQHTYNSVQEAPAFSLQTAYAFEASDRERQLWVAICLQGFQSASPSPISRQASFPDFQACWPRTSLGPLYYAEDFQRLLY